MIEFFHLLRLTLTKRNDISLRIDFDCPKFLVKLETSLGQ